MKLHRVRIKSVDKGLKKKMKCLVKATLGSIQVRKELSCMFWGVGVFPTSHMFNVS